MQKRGLALTASSAVLVLGAGVAIVAFAAPGSHASPVAPVSAANRAATANQAAVARPAGPAAALQLASVTPASGAKGVNGASPIQVHFSSPLAASSAMPTLSPKIAGNWKVQGDTAIFTPVVGYFENTRVTVTIPSGMTSAAGVSAGSGGTLSSAVKTSFSTGSFGTLRLQQLLAQLGYLPMTWSATSGPAIATSNARAELSAAYRAPAGTFSWQGSYPWNLTHQWQAGAANLLQVGAIQAFESVRGLTMDGTAGRTVWSDLLSAVTKGQADPNGYTYALASQHYPESLKIWHNGRLVFTNAANTGIPEAPTADGTFPVYLRYYYQIMKGTNPDGSKYADPVYYVAYFNGGDAVHYFPRYSYGFYQSLGCVELPFDAAKKAWPYLTYGSLVTVTGPVS
ncbi:MAG: Ig-like domain-containing protein [Actinomycetota bacterium]|nr:Ig-like domain-containing protein [Actinomycetota bacterium]